MSTDTLKTDKWQSHTEIFIFSSQACEDHGKLQRMAEEGQTASGLGVWIVTILTLLRVALQVDPSSSHSPPKVPCTDLSRFWSRERHIYSLRTLRDLHIDLCPRRAARGEIPVNYSKSYIITIYSSGQRQGPLHKSQCFTLLDKHDNHSTDLKGFQEPISMPLSKSCFEKPSFLSSIFAEVC